MTRDEEREFRELGDLYEQARYALDRERARLAAAESALGEARRVLEGLEASATLLVEAWVYGPGAYIAPAMDKVTTALAAARSLLAQRIRERDEARESQKATQLEWFRRSEADALRYEQEANALRSRLDAARALAEEWGASEPDCDCCAEHARALRSALAGDAPTPDTKENT